MEDGTIRVENNLYVHSLSHKVCLSYLIVFKIIINSFFFLLMKENFDWCWW